MSADSETFRQRSQQLRDLTDELRAVRERFEPVYKYYVADSWLKVAGRALRLVSEPDYSKYRSELERLANSARSVIDRADVIAKSMDGLRIGPDFARLAQLAYNQIYYDANVIVVFREHINAMAAGDAKLSAETFVVMRHFAQEAQANQRAMNAATHALIQNDGA